MENEGQNQIFMGESDQVITMIKTKKKKKYKRWGGGSGRRVAFTRDKPLGKIVSDGNNFGHRHQILSSPAMNGKELHYAQKDIENNIEVGVIILPESQIDSTTIFIIFSVARWL